MARLDLPLWQRSPAGARHAGVFTRIQYVVDGRRRGSRQADAEIAKQEYTQRHHAGR
jgi:hypothetical protein